MALEEFDQVNLTGFSGLLDRGEPYTDQSPIGEGSRVYLNRAKNLIYHEEGGVGTRPKFEQLAVASGNIPSIHEIVVGNEIRYLYLERGVGIFDSRDNANFILGVSDSEVRSFKIHQIFGRVFINLVKTEASGIIHGFGNLYLYDPNTVGGARLAGGEAPSGQTIQVAQNIPADYETFGDCAVYISVVYETDSGFITPAGPDDRNIIHIDSIRSTGAGSELAIGIDYLRNIPTGPAGTSKRLILVSEPTEEIYTSFSDWNKINWFFAPASVQADFDDNTSVASEFNRLISTAELVDSANHLAELKDRIPCGLDVTDVNARLVVVGHNTADDTIDNSTLFCSDPAKPENFRTVSGQVILNSRDGYRATVAFAQDNILVAFKEVGVWGLNDNGQDPSSWPPILISSGTGAYAVSNPTKDGTRLILDRNGVFSIRGQISPVAMSWPIERLWEEVSKNINFPRSTIILNPGDKSVYVGYSDASAIDDNNKIMYAKYDRPILESLGKWSPWEMKDKKLSGICLGPKGTKSHSARKLVVSGDLGNLAFLSDELSILDLTTHLIEWEFEPSFLEQDGNVQFLQKVRVEGNLKGRIHSSFIERKGDVSIEKRQMRPIFNQNAYDFLVNDKASKYSVRFQEGIRDPVQGINYFRGMAERIDRVIYYQRMLWASAPPYKTFVRDSWVIAGSVLTLDDFENPEALAILVTNSRVMLNGSMYTLSQDVENPGGENNIKLTMTEAINPIVTDELSITLSQ